MGAKCLKSFNKKKNVTFNFRILSQKTGLGPENISPECVGDLFYSVLLID